MAANFAALQKAVDDAVAQATASETTDASAVALLNGQADAIKKAVTDALTADDAADQGSIDAATAAITNVNARFTAANNNLGTAVTANTPAAVPPPTV